MAIGYSGRVRINGVSAAVVSRVLADVATKWGKLVRKAAPFDRHKHPGPETRASGEHLKSHISVRTRGTTIEVVSDRNYLEYILSGTQPHPIFPREKKVLSFPWEEGKKLYRVRKKDGRRVKLFPDGMVAFKHVHHPGLKANNFVKPLLPALRKMIREALRGNILSKQS